MTVFLALIAAAGIVLMIRAIVVVDRAEKVMTEVAAKAREVSNLAAAIKAQNDAMLATHGIGGGGAATGGKMVSIEALQHMDYMVGSHPGVPCYGQIADPGVPKVSVEKPSTVRVVSDGSVNSSGSGMNWYC